MPGREPGRSFMSDEISVNDDDDDERRISDRRRVAMPGNLAGETGMVDCQVQNLSATGAKVQVDVPFHCENTVTLTIHRFGALHGNIIWRHNDKIGISFLTECPELAGFVDAAAAED